MSANLELCNCCLCQPAALFPINARIKDERAGNKICTFLGRAAKGRQAVNIDWWIYGGGGPMLQQPVLRANMSNPGQTLRSDRQGLLKLSSKKIQLKLPVTQLIQPGQLFPQLASKCSFAKKGPKYCLYYNGAFLKISHCAEYGQWPE